MKKLLLLGCLILSFSSFAQGLDLNFSSFKVVKVPLTGCEDELDDITRDNFLSSEPELYYLGHCALEVDEIETFKNADKPLVLVIRSLSLSQEFSETLYATEYAAKYIDADLISIVIGSYRDLKSKKEAFDEENISDTYWMTKSDFLDDNDVDINDGALIFVLDKDRNTFYVNHAPLISDNLELVGAIDNAKHSGETQYLDQNFMYTMRPSTLKEKGLPSDLIMYTRDFVHKKAKSKAPYQVTTRYFNGDAIYSSGYASEIYPNVKYHGEAKVFYPSGRLGMLTNFQDGLKSGKEIRYFDAEGERVTYEVEYEQGLLWRTVSHYDSLGNSLDFGDVINGTGTVNTYSESGSLQESLDLKNGVNHGKSKYYYPDGKLGRVVSYKDGEMDGDYHDYFANGNLKIEGSYQNGEKLGEWKEYYETGEKHLEYSLQQTHHSGIIGTGTEYYNNGNRKRIFSIVNGEISYNSQNFFLEDGSGLADIVESKIKAKDWNLFLRDFKDSGDETSYVLDLFHDEIEKMIDEEGPSYYGQFDYKYGTSTKDKVKDELEFKAGYIKVLYMIVDYIEEELGEDLETSSEAILKEIIHIINQEQTINRNEPYEEKLNEVCKKIDDLVHGDRMKQLNQENEMQYILVMLNLSKHLLSKPGMVSYCIMYYLR